MEENEKKLSVKDALLAEFGPLMHARAICRVLNYPSMTALSAARKRGRLPFVPRTLEGRPGLYASTEEIAGILERALQKPYKVGPEEPVAESSKLNS